MLVQFVINNYQLGSRLRMTPTHKIVNQRRIDRNHVEVLFELDSENEIRFCEKVFAKTAERL